MNSLNISLVVLIVSISASFFYGLVTRNYSTVDRLWSVLPPVYLLIWMPDYYTNPRFVIVFVIVLLWGIRLSANFAAKGGYKFSFRDGFSGEDYRWEVLRGRISNRLAFELFNLFFISAFQLGLIYLFTLPLYFYGSIAGEIKTVEFFLYALHILLLVGEMVSDIQQFRFHKRKNQMPWADESRYRMGFNTFGIWEYSRHPNYVCEMGQWVVVALYLVSVTSVFHFSCLGSLILIALFAGSTVFAESITSSKYPDYAEWKKVTSVWIPFKSLFVIRRRKDFLKGDGRTV